MQHFLFRIVRSGILPGLLWLCFTASAQAKAPLILVLGDSISAAYGMSLEQGWVSLMEQELEASHPGTQVVNASISGETTAGGLRRLPALLQEHKPQLVLIELGANDGLRGYPLSNLRSNLARMVQQSQEAGADVILLPMEIPPNYGGRYTKGFRESFSQLAEDAQTGLTPFVLDGVATRSDLMQSDGLHPTVEAQPLLLANVLPAVVAALESL
tara:strand:- start:125075 stop:125716 length:642 start_codon:yes stop_codon:yes gene_type:complete